MIFDLLKLYDRYDYLFAILLSFIMWIIGFCTKHFSQWIKKHKIRKMLGFKKDNVEILLPGRYGKLTLGAAQAATELIDTFISQGDMDAAIIAKERIMNVAELPSMIVTKPSTENNNNIFCIGGPLANPYVATYLRDRKVFEPLTFGVLDTAPYLCDYNRALLQDIVHKDSCENGVGIRSIRLNGKERWAENQNFIKNKKNY